LGGSDATNYTSWAPRLGFDCRPVAQLWLRNPTYMDNIATIGGLYCVAVKPTFGKNRRPYKSLFGGWTIF